MATATSLYRSAAVRMVTTQVARGRRGFGQLCRPVQAASWGRVALIRPACHYGQGDARSCSQSRAVQQHLRSVATRAYNNTSDLVAKPEYGTEKITVEVGTTSPAEWTGDLLVVAVYEDLLTIPEEKDSDEVVTFNHAQLTELDESLGGILTSLLTPKFKGKSGSSEASRVIGMKTKGAAIVGLGKRDDSSASTWKSLGTTVATVAKSCNAQNAAVVIAGVNGESGGDLSSGICMGSTLGSYSDTRFKKEENANGKLSHISLLGLPEEAKDTAEKGISEASAVAEGILTCKELVSAPPNKLTPATLAAQAKAIADSCDNMSIKVLNKKECEELGMGAYLGVAEASDLEPQFIHLTYKNGDGDLPKVAIIGKGLTYDSGGYNLKPSSGGMIELMKFDMGGAGATLGAARALAELQLQNIEVHFIVAACENMVSGKGMRPGDILTASNGKTIEVNNTDAEGRLTLADALIYTEKLGVTKIVDLATLTGACIVGLGDEVAGLFSTSDELAEEVKTAAKTAGELVWRMPMQMSYKEQLKSSIADMKNTGPVWNAKAGDATGYGVSMLVAWLKMQLKE